MENMLLNNQQHNEKDILKFIASIRNAHSKMVDIFTKGSCLNFYFILKCVYPDAELWYNCNHVITKIDDCFYDITGRVSGENYIKNINNKRQLKQLIKSEYVEQNT